MEEADEKRRELVKKLFPNGIPELWCPLLVHYDHYGKMDKKRSAAHIKELCKYIRTFLIFGSTGDGWELTEQEKEEALDFYISQARKNNFSMLIGVLETECGKNVTSIRKWVEWLKKKAGTTDEKQALKENCICGFTICAPKGKEFEQEKINEELSASLKLGYPTVLYQLPQITLNEISPETVSNLAERFSNFYMFKDTSGTDQVVLKNLYYGNVFFVRGAEGDYSKWFHKNSSGYQGFLLSCANTFASELAEVLTLMKEGREKEAEEKADKVTGWVNAVFIEAQKMEEGNVYANANKCIDHLLAYGKEWRKKEKPMRHCGKEIPEKYLEYAEKCLGERIPDTGYLAE